MLFPSESSVYSSGHLQQSKQQSRILAFYSLAKSQKVFAEIQAQAKKKKKKSSILNLWITWVTKHMKIEEGANNKYMHWYGDACVWCSY